MAEYTPQQQAAVDAYMSGGGSQADVDAYFAGNPSNEQFLQDAGAHWNVDSAGVPLAQTPIEDPKFTKLKTDVSAAYLGAGGSQADIDAYFANNPSYEQVATDAATAYLERGGSQEELSAYFGLPAGYDFSSIMPYNPYAGTNIRPDGSTPNTGPYAPGSGDPLRDPWAQGPMFFGKNNVDPQGNPLPGYGFGADGRTIVKNVEGGRAPVQAPAPQGTPSIFDMFNDLFSQLQTQYPQQTQQAQNFYQKGFAPGSAQDPMVIQNAISAQTDPNSMASLFKNLYKNYSSLQQQQGGSQSIMPGLESDYARGTDPYKSQYVPPAPAPATPVTTGVPSRQQTWIDKAQGKGF